MEHPIYYRILVSRDRSEAFIACLQDFDEIDYDNIPRITDRKFDTEQDARIFAGMILLNPDVPERIKKLVGALVEHHYNVDAYL